MSSRASIWLACIAAVLIAVPAAHANVTFCNKYPRTIYVAIAYPQDDGSFMSRGWLPLDTGQCAPFDTALRVKSLYYRAQATPVRQGRKETTQVWSRDDRKFALWVKDNFNYWNAERQVFNSTLEGFSLVGETNGDELTATVIFLEDGIHVTTSIKGPGN